MSLLLLALVFAPCLIYSSEQCVYQCMENNSCSDTTIYCNQCTQNCNIKCIGIESCDNLQIIQDKTSSQIINLQCEGQNSCKNIQFINDDNIDNNINYKNNQKENILSFICECIPFDLYSIYKNIIMDMFHYLKDNNFWLYAYTNVLERAIEMTYTPQLIDYDIINHDKYSFYFNHNNNDEVSMDYIIHNLLQYNNDCEAIDDYILSHLDAIPNNMQIICFLNGISYQLLEILGDSSYVFVIKAKVVSTGEIVVIKLFDMESSHCNYDLLQTEIESQKICNVVIGDQSVKIMDHSNINYNENRQENKFRFVIVMEYISDGDLSKYIKNRLKSDSELKQEEFANFMVCRLLDDISFSLLLLFEYKSLNYLHNDIKPSNLFIDLKKMEFKLGDYGHMLTMSYIFNKTNEINALGTPNYISVSMSDLMLNIFSDEILYNKAKNMYLKYPNHADLYQLLSSALSLYNTICDANNNKQFQTNICQQINDKKLDLDLNAEDRNSSFIRHGNVDEDYDGLLYVVNKKRHERIKNINTTHKNTVINLIFSYIIGLYDDYLGYKMNDTDSINSYDINNETYSLKTFRNDLQNVCNEYMFDHEADNKYIFNYQIWKYDENINHIELDKLFHDIDINQFGQQYDYNYNNDVCKDKIIIYDRQNGNIIFPNKDNLTSIHNQLIHTAVAFNNLYYF